MKREKINDYERMNNDERYIYSRLKDYFKYDIYFIHYDNENEIDLIIEKSDDEYIFSINLENYQINIFNEYFLENDNINELIKNLYLMIIENDIYNKNIKNHSMNNDYFEIYNSIFDLNIYYK